MTLLKTSEVTDLPTTSYSLGKLLRRVKNGTLTVPRFQRDFVWKRKDVRLLVDSISRSYPIGSLLLLAKSPNLPLADQPVNAKVFPDRTSESSTQTSHLKEKHYILDGQQRITSISRVFLNDADEKVCYYFDLEKMLDSGDYDKHQDSWIDITLRGHKKKIADKETKGQYLSPHIVLDQGESHRHVSKYIRSREDFDQDRCIDAEVKITGIFEAIRNYEVPVVTIEQDNGLESICRIFEAVNSTGARLKTFDLAVARFYSEEVDLREWWLRTQKKHKILEDFEVGGERILQVLYLMTAIHSQENQENQKNYIEPTQGNLLNLEPSQIKQEWENSSESLAKIYKWAQAQGAKPKCNGSKSTLPNDNILLSLAAVKSLKDKLNNHFIRRWYFSKTIQTGVSQSLNYQIGQNYLELRNYAEFDIRPQLPKVTLSIEILLKPISSDIRYKALQNILATTIRKDLITGQNIDPESELENHHIFPKSFGKKDRKLGGKLDSICNRITILKKSNRNLSNKPPQTYFKDMVDDACKEGPGALDDLKDRMKYCLIPGDPGDPQWPDSFSVARFEEFCKNRANLIIEKVRQVIGDSLEIVSPSSSNQVEDEVEDDDE